MSDFATKVLADLADLRRDVERMSREAYGSPARRRDDELEREITRLATYWVTGSISAFDPIGAADSKAPADAEYLVGALDSDLTNERLVTNTTYLTWDLTTPGQAKVNLGAHAATHVSGGSDSIKLDDLAAPDDNTDLNASTSAHGLLRKLPGTGSTQYLDGDGNFTAPSGTGAPTTADYLVKTADGTLSAERVVTDTTSITVDWGTAGQAKFQRAALTGDVTASANSNTTTIANGAVTAAKTSITGTPTGSKYLRDDFSWQTVSATVADGDKGDIVVSGTGTIWTIDANVVTFAKMAQATAASLLIGRGVGAGGGDWQEINLTSSALVMTGATTLDVKTAGITFARIQDLAASSLIGRRSGSGSGVSENVTLTSAFSMNASGVLDLQTGGVALSKLVDLASTSLIGRISGSGSGAPSNITLGASLTISAGGVMSTVSAPPSGSAGGDLTGTYPNPTIKASVSLTTPVIGVATGTSHAATGLIKSSSASAGVGYATGAGGTVTQATSKSTGVTLNTVCGAITMNNAALAAAALVSFTLTNSSIAAADQVTVSIKSGATVDTYIVGVTACAAGSCRIQVFNASGASQSEAIVLTFLVVKGAIS